MDEKKAEEMSGARRVEVHRLCLPIGMYIHVRIYFILYVYFLVVWNYNYTVINVVHKIKYWLDYIVYCKKRVNIFCVTFPQILQSNKFLLRQNK